MQVPAERIGWARCDAVESRVVVDRLPTSIAAISSQYSHSDRHRHARQQKRLAMADLKDPKIAEGSCWRQGTPTRPCSRGKDGLVAG